MITDQQIRSLIKMMNQGKNKKITADKAGMDVKTARKYLKSRKRPSQMKKKHCWRTRKNSFSKEWSIIKDMLEPNSGLEVKTIFEMLQRNYPGKFQDGQLRTLQRQIKVWRATEGPHKEVFFELL